MKKYSNITQMSLQRDNRIPLFLAVLTMVFSGILMSPVNDIPNTKPCTGEADVVFLIGLEKHDHNKDFNVDFSSGERKTDSSRQLMYSILHNLTDILLDRFPGQNQIRMGVMEYTLSTVKPILYLDQYKDRRTFKSAIQGLRNATPSNNMREYKEPPLKFLAETMFSEKHGSRPSARNIGIILDGPNMFTPDLNDRGAPHDSALPMILMTAVTVSNPPAGVPGTMPPNSFYALSLPLPDQWVPVTERIERAVCTDLASQTACPSNTVQAPITNMTLQIPAMLEAQSYVSPDICPCDGQPLFTLQCRRNRLGTMWAPVENNPNCDVTMLSSSPVSSTLQRITQDAASHKTGTDVPIAYASEALDAVRRESAVSTVDVLYLDRILQKYSALPAVTPETANILLEIASTTLNFSSLEHCNRLTNSIIEVIDELGEKLTLNRSFARVVTKSIALETWDLSSDTDDVVTGLKLIADKDQKLQSLKPTDIKSLRGATADNTRDAVTAIYLPRDFIHEIRNENAGQAIKLSTAVYINSAAFQAGPLETFQSEMTSFDANTTSDQPTILNGVVISATLLVNGNTVTGLGNHVVTTDYRPFPTLNSSHRIICVFWNVTGNGGSGAWSDQGCFLRNRSIDRVVCVCDHLTHFAALVDLRINGADFEGAALSYITYIGLGLSVGGLSITVLSFICIRKLWQSRAQKTLFNLSLAMLIAWVIFLTGFERTSHRLVCLGVSALLHYFILTSFMWMLMEALLQYLLFVRVVGHFDSHYMLKTGIPAWGLPCIPVAVVLIYNKDLYLGFDRYCWMSETPFYYAFIAPLAVIIAINMVVYVRVLVSLYTSDPMIRSHVRKTVGIKASLACFVVLGLSWVFAFFAIRDAREVFQYLFTITCSLQGFFIFLAFTCRNREVRKYWAKILCCRRTLKTPPQKT